MEKLSCIALMIFTAIVFLIAQIAIVLNPEMIAPIPEFLRGYIAIHIPYIAAFIIIAAGSGFIHIPVSELISQRIRPRSMLIAGAVYAVLLAATDLLYAGSIEPTGVRPAIFLAELAAVLICTPIQAASEELFFRALPCRIGYGKNWPSDAMKAIPFILFSGVLFLLPHLGNREIGAASNALLPAVYYFSWGALAALLGAASGGFEAVIAMHTVNNMHVALIVNYRSSSMMTEALFFNNTLPGDMKSIIAAYIAFAVIYVSLECAGCIKEGFIIHGRKKE